ncbi:histone-fold-containing protein [Trichoderma longibrachiatum]|uniref:Histone-fold-containing protein n=1 Tax=Trichoderma longibrachiatum ATCC 18648 TaxID=983965 RepID=A0A2T4BUL9_TRILO|nr:histone-fold-containing protein [Trichoderma longibrachiatum ATCC 18648]
MPYNTNAIPPRKEPTGQTQLPLSRVKKIISQDPDVQMCSNNAAFVITLAAEMFIQHLTEEAHTQAKLERKPRRNIQYKDVANAISHRDHLEFLEDVAPKTIPFKKAKAINQARLRGEPVPTNGTSASSKSKSTKGQQHAAGVNGQAKASGTNPFTLSLRNEEKDSSRKHGEGNNGVGNGNRTDDPSDQLELETRRAARPEEDDDADVDMTG